MNDHDFYRLFDYWPLAVVLSFIWACWTPVSVKLQSKDD